MCIQLGVMPVSSQIVREREGESVLEGVTHLEGAMNGECLHPLHCSLAKLEFWHSFQPKPAAGDLAIESSKIWCYL